MKTWTPERRREYMREYRATHPLTPEQKESKNARQRKRYAEDPSMRTRAKERAKQWALLNPLKDAEQKLAYHRHCVQYYTETINNLKKINK